jgi:hypothetical protein
MSHFYRTFSRLCPDYYFPYLIGRIKDGYKEKMKRSNGSYLEKDILDLNFDISLLQDEWESVKSDKMLKIARKYDLIIPRKTDESFIDCWCETSYRTSYLNSDGRNFIKKQLREEQKWKHDTLSFVFTTIIGLIGSLIGLLSIVLKK